MNKEDLYKFQELYDKFLEDCNRVADILCAAPEYQTECGNISFAEKFSLEDDTVFWEGDEYWNYGGHEFHSGTFPAKYLLLSDEDLRNLVNEKVEKYNKEQEEKKKKKAEAEKAARLAQYEKLKKEFDGTEG